MNTKRRFLVNLFLAILFVSSCCLPILSAEKKGAKYLGAKSCKGCHKEQFEVMSKTKMFKALEALKTEKAKKINPKAATDTKCLKCHVTGLGKEGGYNPKAKDEDNANVAFVGCEACHGPGGEYMKIMAKAMPTGSGKYDAEAAKKAGLIAPSEAVCVKCHNKESPFYKEFKYEKFAKEIYHHNKEHHHENE
ncbi:MAG: cytochrome c family protein [bacterium]